MQIDVIQKDDISSIAKLNGVLDEDARGAFENQLHPLITDQGKRLIIDLSGVPRLTSSGLSCLVTLVARANAKGSNIFLAAATPFVESVIGVTRLDRFFTMVPTVESAVHG